MSKYLLLGIGGTGSRIVESCLALFASGLGPRDGVHLGLVDQDGQNGNGGRTDRMFKAIARLQGEIGTEAGGFPGIPITSFREDQFYWHDQMNLSWKPDVEDQPLVELLNIENAAEPHKTLFAHLYEKDETIEPIAIGFKGHANVGAAATYAALMDPKGEFNKRLEQIAKQAEGMNNELRVFLAGSIFGGMGASGFPTIARRLRRLRDDAPNAKIRVGGVLMLPYFTFKDDDEDKFALKSREILQNSRQALEFYADLLGSEPDIFDRFYLTGWNDFFELDYGKKGGPDQVNPPMPPELYSAAAALEFFTDAEIEAPGAGERRPQALPIKITGRANENALAWSDMTAHDDIMPALGRLLRLAAYWRYSIDPALRVQPPVAAEWRHLTGNVDAELLDLLVQEAAANRNGAFDLLLSWAGGMQIFAATDRDLNFGLWNLGCVEGNLASPQAGVSLRGQEQSAGPLYDELIAAAERDACDLYAEISLRGASARATTANGMAHFVRSADSAARITN
jgi:hypothetical protein